MRAKEFVIFDKSLISTILEQDVSKNIIRLKSPKLAKDWIEKVYAKYPQTWQNNHVMPLGGEGDDQQFALFELVPSMSKRNAVEIKWFQAYPLGQGIGSRAMEVLQTLAAEDGIALTLFPWDKGQVSQSKLIKFYKKLGFKPIQKGGRSLVWEPVQGVAEGSEDYNGIQLSLEVEKDDEYVDDEDTDNQTIYVKATANGRELGHVLFTIDYDSQGMVLNPQDLEVDDRYRGQGIAATMYDYVKSKGYRIRRSGQQTDAGAGFWNKHKPGKNIWEQGVAEATGDEKFDSMMGQITGGANARQGVDRLRQSMTARTGSEPETALAKWGLEFIKWLEDFCRNRIGPDRILQQYPDLLPDLEQLDNLDDGGQTMAQWLVKAARKTDTVGITLADIREFADKFNDYGPWAWHQFPMAWSQGEWQDYKDQWSGPDGYIANLDQDLAEDTLDESLTQPYNLIDWDQLDFDKPVTTWAALPDGTDLVIEFEREYPFHNDWSVGFKRGGSIAKTGQGKAPRIFATVLLAIKQFIKRQQPDALSFSAIKHEDEAGSRRSLYDALAKKYAAGLGYSLNVKDDTYQQHYIFKKIKPEVAESQLDEIGYSDKLGDLSVPHEKIIAGATKDGTISQKPVMKYEQGNATLFFFVDNGNISALVLIADGNKLRAIKNFTGQSGQVFALINYIVNLANLRLTITPDEPLTKEGFSWIAKLIKKPSGLKITDLNGNPIDIDGLRKEWLKSKSTQGTKSGNTGIVISESSQQWKTKLQENESRLMPHIYFDVSDNKKQGVVEGTNRQPLDFDSLYGQAFKITDNNGDPKNPGFSIVTPLNGAAWHWRERPEFKAIVKQKLNDPGFIGDHKYQQIIDAISGNKFNPDKHVMKDVAKDNLDEGVNDNFLYHATMAGSLMRILRDGTIKASWRPQATTKLRTQFPTISTTRSKHYAESDDFVNFLNLTKEGNEAILVFDRDAIARHYKMFSTSQGTQTVGDEFEEVIVVPKGVMPIKGTLIGFYFNPNRTEELKEYENIPWFKVLLNSPYNLNKKSTQNVTENFADGRNPQDKGDSRRLGITKHASLAQLDKIGSGSGRKAQLARWQANMRRGRAKKK